MGKRGEIECLERLQELTHLFSEILSFLVEENILTKEGVDAHIKAGLHAKSMQQLLANLKATNKIQLLEYTWTILPIERITLLIVTDRNQRTFDYDGV